MSTYPTLPEIERETEYLLKAKENLVRTNAPNRQIEEVIKKIELCEKQYLQEM